MIYKEVGICDLFENLWSGAIDTYNTLIEHKITEEEIEEMINSFFPDDVNLTELNDFFWFDSEEILSYFGIEEEEE